jgi:hypothetical protein
VYSATAWRNSKILAKNFWRGDLATFGNLPSLVVGFEVVNIGGYEEF